MRSVRARRWWRWLVVGGGVAALLALPAVVRAWPVDAQAVAPADLAARIAASATQPYSGTVTARGGLALPDLPGARDQADLFGSASRLRVWYRSPTAWRVDQLNRVGEIDTYASRGRISIWDSGRRLVRHIDDEPELRLPRAADLPPPELARRLLAGAAPGELQTLTPVRVANHAAPGVRIVPADPASTVATIDIWADADTGLALRVAVVPKGTDVPILETRFLEVSLSAPDADTVRLDPPAGVRQRSEGADDPVAEIGRRSQLRLPRQVAGLPRTSTQTTGAALYGHGFTQVLVVALPGTFGRGLLPATDRPWGGPARVLTTPLVNAMGFTAGGTTYVVAGAVTVEELDRIAAAISTPTP